MQLLLSMLLSVAPPEADYGQATAELQTAIENSTSEDRKAAIAVLADAIALQGQYPDEASSTVPESVLEARVILVRLYIAEKNVQAAQAAMDDLIRTAREQTPPVRSYGREVTELYPARQAALQAAGVATLEFDCHIACDMIVNERRSATASEKLFLGTYRIWVKTTGAAVGWEYHEVELVEAGAVTTVVYGNPNPAVDDEIPPQSTPPKGCAVAPELEPEANLALLGLGWSFGVGLSIAGRRRRSSES